MKIAIFISGQPRLIDLSLINYFKMKNIDYDIYIHYWIPKDVNDYSIRTTGIINNTNLMYKKNINDILIKYYNPKIIKGEIQRDFKKIKLNKNINFRELENLEYYENCSDKNVNPNVPQSCAYSCKKAFQLCENTEEYDWLVKIRFDTYGPLYHDRNIRAVVHTRNRNILLKYSKQKNIIIDFNKCDKTKINFFNIYNKSPSDRGEPMSEIWIVSNICKKIFYYYDDLINCGSHTANEPIIYNFCNNHKLKINNIGITFGYNRDYNNTNYVFI